MKKQLGGGYLSARQVANWHGVSRQRVYQWIEEGKVEVIESPLGLLVTLASCAQLKAERDLIQMARQRRYANNETALAAVAN